MTKPKTILQVYPTIANLDEMKERQPIGRDREAYREMLDHLKNVVRVADDHGYWGITHVEHHFHSEGLEISPNPQLLNVFLGQETDQLRMGQLGNVLPARDPIRLAEDTAMTDQILEGDYFVGMARGYQSRWMDTLGQPFGVRETYSDGSEQDQHNREIFEENYEIMKKAWTEDVIQYDGEHYKVPGSNPEWPAAETTKEYGAPGELDEEGRVQKVSVVPKPYSDPHPQLFQAFSLSEETMRWCGRENITPTILFGPLGRARELMETHNAAANEAGHGLDFGENIGLCRTFHFGETEEEIHEKIREYEYPVWQSWYKKFGFLECLRYPDEDIDPMELPKDDETLAERLIDSNLAICGTPDEVAEELQRQLDECSAEYLIWLYHSALMPEEEALEQLRIMADEVFPKIDLDHTS